MAGKSARTSIVRAFVRTEQWSAAKVQDGFVLLEEEERAGVLREEITATTGNR